MNQLPIPADSVIVKLDSITQSLGALKLGIGSEQHRRLLQLILDASENKGERTPVVVTGGETPLTSDSITILNLQIPLGFLIHKGQNVYSQYHPAENSVSYTL